MNRRESRCPHRQHGNACGPGTRPETGTTSRSECLNCLHAERPAPHALLQQASRSVTAHTEISRTRTQSLLLMPLLLNRALPHRPCLNGNCCVEPHMSRYWTTLTQAYHPKFFPFRSCCWKGVNTPSKSIRIPERHAQAMERHSQSPCGATVGWRCSAPSLTGCGSAHSIAAAHKPNGEVGLPCVPGGPGASNEDSAKKKIHVTAFGIPELDAVK